MPYIHTRELRGIVRRFWGHVTAAEIAELANNVQGDTRFDELRYILNDFSDCASVDMPRAKLMEIAAKDSGAAFTNSQFGLLSFLVTQMCCELPMPTWLRH